MAGPAWIPPGPGVRVQHHLLLCATPSKPLCSSDPAVGAASWEALKRLLRELGLEDPARREGVIWRTKADCLRVCREGPVLHIWPEGITYGAITPERIERIVRQHLIGGSPVEEWILRRTPLAVAGSGDGAAAAATATPSLRDDAPPPG
jgi:(2Fe-2S) ferredoxin